MGLPTGLHSRARGLIRAGAGGQVSREQKSRRVLKLAPCHPRGAGQWGPEEGVRRAKAQGKSWREQAARGRITQQGAEDLLHEVLKSQKHTRGLQSGPEGSRTAHSS